MPATTINITKNIIPDHLFKTAGLIPTMTLDNTRHNTSAMITTPINANTLTGLIPLLILIYLVSFNYSIVAPVTYPLSIVTDILLSPNMYCIIPVPVSDL